jgi:hypothetical protein
LQKQALILKSNLIKIDEKGTFTPKKILKALQSPQKSLRKYRKADHQG